MVALAGAGLVIVAATMLYLASPNQKLAVISARRPLGWIGVALMTAGLLLVAGWAGPATSVFIALTAAMTIWSIVPLAVAWRRGGGGKA